MAVYKALHLNSETDRLLVSKEKEEDYSPALRIAQIHQYKYSRNTLKRPKKDYLQ